MTVQTAVLEPVPSHARHLFFGLNPSARPGDALQALAAACDGRSAMVGIGQGAAVQQWPHDFPLYEAMLRAEQATCFGRRRDDNEEIEDAPESVHVKRTAQEDFDPEAFVVRRSFEARLRRMTGRDDGISDALFSFTRPLSGGYYWCLPLGAAGIDLRALGL